MQQQWIKIGEWLAAKCRNITDDGLCGGGGWLGIALLLALLLVPIWAVWHNGYALGMSDGVPVCRAN